MSRLEKVETRDGSTSYKNNDVDETYHSLSGATNEALRKHVRPSKLLDKEDVVVADICFGLGYNSIVAIAEHQKKYLEGIIQIFAFENDKEILDKIHEVDYGEYEAQAEIIRNLLKKDTSPLTYEQDNVIITLYVGDIRESILEIVDDIFDVVFFDPFSPKKHPHLWSQELFSQIYRTMSKDAILTTYSCARMARENMLAVGFSVRDGPVVGRTSPGTLAKKERS